MSRRRRDSFVGFLLFAVGYVGFEIWDTAAHSKVTVQANPGSAVAVHFRRAIKDSGIEAADLIDATLHLAPDPLPQRITVLRSQGWFSFENASGDLLLWIPEGASGTAELGVEATGSGIVMGQGRREIRSNHLGISIEIVPGGVDQGAPRSWRVRGPRRP